MANVNNALDQEKTLESLRPYFEKGMSIRKACEASGICDDQTIWNWINKDQSVSTRIIAWQNTVSTQARTVVADAILGKGIEFTQRERVRHAKWWLKHKDRKEFSTRQEIENTGSIEFTSKGRQVDTLLDDLRNRNKRKRDNKKGS